MKIKKSAFRIPILFFPLVLLPGGCGLIDWNELLEPEPTRARMEGVWELVEAYNENDSSIIDQINFPTTVFYLKSGNSVISTAGPMIAYIVYGDSRYTDIASKIDQVFDYAELDVTTDGEWFIEGGAVDRFTLEMKLEGLPGQKALTDLLGWLGIGGGYLETTIYHKFIDVEVTFDDLSDSVMTWEFDAQTEAVYNTKDNKTGSYILWEGVSAKNFSSCTFVFAKRVRDLEELIKDAASE